MTQSAGTSGPASGQSPQSAVPYASPPTPAERETDAEFQRLLKGASVLRTCAGVLTGLGWALVGLGIAGVVGAFISAARSGPLVSPLLGAIGLLVQGFVLFVLATYLRTQAAVAIVMGDVARRVGV